jgi:hypothetical protein
MCLVRHPHRLEGVQPGSPAVRDYLGLGSLDMVDWRFVEQADVLAGPWSSYLPMVERSRSSGNSALKDLGS